MNEKILAAVVFFGAIAAMLSPVVSYAEPSHGLAMHGDPMLPADFRHFPYANPDAPKGGSVTYGVVGTFDSLNPFVLKSMRTTARGIIDPEFGNLVFEPLMQRSRDEPFTLYGLLAQTAEWNDERTWIEFTLDDDARWSDGKPVTPEDVIFTYELFAEKARPPYSSRMSRIAAIEKTGERTVKFTFNNKSNREYPLIIALTPILPKHAINAETFGESTLDMPVGSGPYVVEKVEPGTRIVYKRNPDYWGVKKPSMVGFANHNRITVEYFRDGTARFEAFKKGVFDIFAESDSVKWETSYDFPAVAEGRVKTASFVSDKPDNYLGFFFNTRRPVFADVRVREAVSMLFDFEWVNANLYSGRYRRTASFWQNSSELSALGRPANDAERAMVANFADVVSPSVLEGTWAPPVTDGSGRDRNALRAAVAKFSEAGYAIEGGLMMKDGVQLSFEILIGTVIGATQNEIERMALALQRSAEAIGIAVTLRGVDDAQFQKRRQTFDYDMTASSLSASLSPGAEQVGRWGSESADPEGTFNLAGVKNPAVDAMIETIVNARTREELAAAVRVLDRILISGHYAIPLYHQRESWVAHWDHIRYPDGPTPLYGYQLPVWWSTK